MKHSGLLGEVGWNLRMCSSKGEMIQFDQFIASVPGYSAGDLFWDGENVIQWLSSLKQSGIKRSL